MRISDWSSDVCSSDLYAASTKARTTVIGGPNEMYGVLTDPDDKGERDYHWGDMWHYAIARMVVAARAAGLRPIDGPRSEEHTSELQSLMRISYAVFCLKKKKTSTTIIKHKTY